ncbi:hypothetical protein NHQ30_009694 [Ciborinia camelliae]|nr:hypothetical protein NHQ30_009694 [Ciborinia camelliae]
MRARDVRNKAHIVVERVTPFRSFGNYGYFFSLLKIFVEYGPAVNEHAPWPANPHTDFIPMRFLRYKSATAIDEPTEEAEEAEEAEEEGSSMDVTFNPKKDPRMSTSVVVTECGPIGFMTKFGRFPP